MKTKAILHDLKKIANTLRLMSMEAKKKKPDIGKFRYEVYLLAQHIDKLHRDLEIKLTTKLLSIILCIFILGCGTTGKVFVWEDGIKKQKIEMHLDKEGALRYKENPDGTIEAEFDSRKPTFWERYIQPIIGKASQQAQATTEVR